MSPLVLIAILIVILVLSWAAQFLLRSIRCKLQYRDEVEKRLQSISRQI